MGHYYLSFTAGIIYDRGERVNNVDDVTRNRRDGQDSWCLKLSCCNIPCTCNHHPLPSPLQLRYYVLIPSCSSESINPLCLEPLPAGRRVGRGFLRLRLVPEHANTLHLAESIWLQYSSFPGTSPSHGYGRA